MCREPPNSCIQKLVRQFVKTFESLSRLPIGQPNFKRLQNFFRVRFDRLTPSEKRFLRAMAELGPDAHRTSDIADKLGVKVTSLGPVRAKLIRKGMVYSPAHGDMAFTVPLFDEFMRRAMPTFVP